MEYKQLAGLECHCGSQEFGVESRVTKSLPLANHNETILCDQWCAFRRRRIAAGGVSPSDCRECRSIEIETGRIVCTCARKWEISHGMPQFSRKTVSQSADPGLRVVETDFGNDPRWNPFVKAHPDGSIFHHSLWLEALSREFDQDTLCLGCEDREGRVHGSLPLIYTRGLPFGVSRIGNAVDLHSRIAFWGIPYREAHHRPKTILLTSHASRRPPIRPPRSNHPANRGGCSEGKIGTWRNAPTQVP
jgi:hypothetical protein